MHVLRLHYIPLTSAHDGYVDYHWQELWRALVLLLDFLASKLESLTTTGGVEQLVQEVGFSYIGNTRSTLTYVPRRYCSSTLLSAAASSSYQAPPQ